MPNVTIINDTQVPLNICLKQVSPLHKGAVSNGLRAWVGVSMNHCA